MTWGMPLWLLGVPVSLIALIWGVVSHWRRSAAGEGSGMKAVSVDSGRLREMVNGLRPPGRLIFFWLGMAFLAIAMARPQVGWVELPRFEQSREVIVALDLSKSMWADDVQPSRLERSRLLVDNLLDHLKGERVGLVLFAGTAFTQSPLSADYEVLREFLPELSPEYLPQGGTNYAAMLDVVLESFSQGPDSAANRYLIVLSDGESLSDAWQSRMDALKEAGVKVIGLGVGTPAGAVIQDPSGGVIKDQSGSVVLSRLNAATLQALARGTGGEYRQADRWLDLPGLLKLTVEKGRKGEFSENKDRKPMERYQIPLLVGLLFFALSFWREYPVRPRVSKTRKSEGAGLSGGQGPIGNLGAVPPPLPASVAVWLLSTLLLSAQSPMSAPQGNPAQKLTEVVVQLSQKKILEARDYAALAEVTVATGKAMLSTGASLPRGAVEDGLEAVLEGEQLDAGAADWEALRKALEELLEQTPEQKQEQQEEEPQEDQNQENQNSEQNNSSQNGQEGEQDQQENQSSENSQEGKDSEQSKQDQQGQQGDSNSDSQNSDTQNGEDSQEGEDQSKNQEQSPGKESQRNEDNQLGPLNDKPESGEESGKKAPPQKPQKLQTVQGSSNEGSGSQSKDPAVVAAMKELSQVKDRDVPAKLFQRMQTDQQPRQQGKDW